MRIIGNRELKDLVIVDNSVYSFAFQIDNGIPIIPFYNDPADEEMLHLIYYLSCLSAAEDVRQQNRAAFELYKLTNGDESDRSHQSAVTPQQDKGKKTVPIMEEDEESESSFNKNPSVVESLYNEDLPREDSLI